MMGRLEGRRDRLVMESILVSLVNTPVSAKMLMNAQPGSIFGVSWARDSKHFATASADQTVGWVAVSPMRMFLTSL